MKKHGLLLSILSVLALTSCSLLPNMTPSRRNRSSKEENSITESSSPSASKHTHVYGDWVVTVAPTCTTQGKEERRCIECGQTQSRNTNQLGHDYQYQEIIQQPTCTESGYIQYRCTRCGATVVEEIKGDHQWSEPMNVEPIYEGCVAYGISECYQCGSKKIDIKALDCTLAAGSSIKSGTANGFFKLTSTGNSASWRFNYIPPEGQSGAYGMAYTRGMLDYWSSNPDKQYGIYSTSSSDARPEGNFDFSVNGNLVDKSEYMNMTFRELFADGEDSSYIGENYSNIALVPVGQVYLQNGINEIVYTRTGSYNLLISDLVFIVAGENHVHEFGADWCADENEHWHVCNAEGCPLPNVRFDAGIHTWSEPFDEVPATCEFDGSYKIKCTVCNYVRTISISQTGHNWIVDVTQEVVQPTKDAPGHYTMICSLCGQTKDINTVYGQTMETALTVDEALAIGDPLQHQTQTAISYYIRGRITEVLRLYESNNQATFWLASSSESRGFECYNINAGSLEQLNSLQVGSEVLVFGAIRRYNTTIETASGAIICSVRNETVAQPTGTFFTDIILTDEGKAALNTSKSAIPFIMLFGEANTVTIYADGNDAGAYIKSFDGFDGTLIIGTTMFGDLSMVYEPQSSMMMSLTMLEDLNYFAYNGIVSIKGNDKIKYWNCDGTDEQLQEQFVRRYNNPWVVDTNNADRLTSNSEHYITGNGMRLRPWAGGRIALALKDLDVAFNTNHLSFWVYNSGESDIQLSAFAYKEVSFQNYFQIFSGVSAKAGEWTYFSVGFSASNIYSFQIVVSNPTETPLIFDDIVLS